MRTIYTNIEKTSRRSKGIRIYLFILSAIIIVVLGLLWVTLFRFQGRVDKENSEDEANGVAFEDSLEVSEEDIQNCFENYLDNMTLEDWTNLWYGMHPDHLDSDIDVAMFIQSHIIDAGCDRFKASGYSLQAPEYVLAKDDNMVAGFKLSKNADDWMVSEVTINIEGDNSFEATLDESFNLYINDSLVPLDYVDSSSNALSVTGYDDQLIMPRTMSHYTVNGLIALIEEGSNNVLVTDDNGRIASLAVDGLYYETIDGTDGDDYRQRANDFIKSLLNYYSKGKENAEGNMHSVLGHVASGSEAAKVINNSLSGVVWRVADYSVSYATECSRAYVLADNCCFVDVTYTEETPSTTYEIGDGVYRVYFLHDENGSRIVQFAGIK